MIHIHIHGATIDAAPSLREMYAELVQRILDAAQQAASGQSTKDEEFGHPFHGNQWVNGISGPKPTSTESKVPKHAMYELLASGHPFSLSELMTIAGVDKESTAKSFLYFFKAGGAKNSNKPSLDIKKLKDGTYQVVMPDGTAAPALPAAEMAEIKAEAEKAVTKAKKKPAQEPAKPEASPAPTPAPTKAPVADPEPAKGPVSKEQADKDYQGKLHAASDKLQNVLVGFYSGPDAEALKGKPEFAQTALLGFKNAKAHAMASWAEQVQGVQQVVKPQEVYKADWQLAYDFSQGAQWDEAFTAWKTNTSKEKQGVFHNSWEKPTAATIKSAVKQAPPPAPLPAVAGSEPLVDYSAIVPDDHKSIGAEDFEDTKWFKGIGKLDTALLDDSLYDSGNKAKIEKTLRERLKGSKAFQALKDRYPGPPAGESSLESALIHSWAASSGDNNDLSCALQIAARDAFHMPHDSVETSPLHALKGKSEAELFMGALSPCKLTSKDTATAKAALQDFVLAQYQETQKLFAEKGIKEVYLARGMKFHHDVDPTQGPAKVKFQPASSFSANYGTASAFAGSSGTVFLVKVPATQVLSTYLTGFGCTSEHEVVVLSHKETHAFTVPKSDVKTAAEASAHIFNRLQKGKKK